MTRKLYALLIAALWLTPGLSQAAPGPFDRLYVFGDSYSDSGAGYVDGNGPTAVVYMARGLDIPFTYAGAPDAADKGLNFAVSSAQTGRRAGYHVRPATEEKPGPGEALLGRGMRNQVDDFIALSRDQRTRWVPGRTLFFIAGGLNDGALPTATTITNLSGELRDLHAAGARNFLVATLPTKIPAFAGVAARLNPALVQMVTDLSREFPDSRIFVSGWGGDFDKILEAPETFGFTDIKSGCAKREIFGEDPATCSDPESRFFYHDAHPSTKAHAIVGGELAAEVRGLFGDGRRGDGK